VVGCRLLYTLLLLAGIASHAIAQQGGFVGTLEGGVVKYHGEFSDDMFGPQGMVSLRYAALDNLWVGARFGLGEYQWKVTPSKVAAYPDYFGQGATLGDRYPGGTSSIEARNESRVSSADLVVYYVLTMSIPARPYVVAGIGGINIEPSTASDHTALPNAQRGRYPKTISSVIVGGGVAIPLSERVGLELAAEHRFAFSRYLDDLATNRGNDALTSIRIGISYAFSTGSSQSSSDIRMRSCGNSADVSCCIDCELCDCFRCCSCCCCCCCCNGQGSGGGAAPSSAPDTTKPAPGPPQAGGGGPKPEPMGVPCPPGQHRECYGPPGFGICVDDKPPVGPERIRWELARTLGDGSLLREADGKWYRKQVLPDGTSRVTKGVLPFTASECKECKEKQEREARESMNNQGTKK
jgi:opacity protein-like surface antigen